MKQTKANRLDLRRSKYEKVLTPHIRGEMLLEVTLSALKLKFRGEGMLMSTKKLFRVCDRLDKAGFESYISVEDFKPVVYLKDKD